MSFITGDPLRDPTQHSRNLRVGSPTIRLCSALRSYKPHCALLASHVFHDPTNIIPCSCQNTHLLKDLLRIPRCARRPLLLQNPFKFVIHGAKRTHVVKYRRNATSNIAPYDLLMVNASQTIELDARGQHPDCLPAFAVLPQVVSTLRRVCRFRSSLLSVLPSHRVSRLLDPCCQGGSDAPEPNCEDGCCPGPNPSCNLDTPSVECDRGKRRFRCASIQVPKITHVLVLQVYKTIAAPIVLLREAIPNVDKMTQMLIHWPRTVITALNVSRRAVRDVVKHVLLIPSG